MNDNENTQTVDQPDTGAPEPAAPQPAEPAQPNDQPENGSTQQEASHEEEPVDAHSTAEAAMQKLLPEPEGTPKEGEEGESKGQEAASDGTPPAPGKEYGKPADAQGAAPAQPKVPGEKPQPKELTDADLVRSIPSERGRERIAKLLSEGRQSQQQVQQFQQAVQSAGLDQESFSNLLQISQLVSSPNQQDIERGLQMFEQVRTSLYRSLNREAPGVDALDGFDDLKEKVKSMGMDRKDAVAIAQSRREQVARAQQLQAQQAMAQDQQQFVQRIEHFKQSAMQAIKTRANDIDFQAKLDILTKQLSDPQRLQRLVSTMPPEAWPDMLLTMYDSIQAPVRAAPRPVARPLAGRTPSGLGRRTGDRGPVTAETAVEKQMQEMGL